MPVTSGRAPSDVASAPSTTSRPREIHFTPFAESTAMRTSNTKKILSALAVSAAALSVLAPSAWGQDALSACVGRKDDKERLACYDAATGRTSRTRVREGDRREEEDERPRRTDDERFRRTEDAARRTDDERFRRTDDERPRARRAERDRAPARRRLRRRRDPEGQRGCRRPRAQVQGQQSRSGDQAAWLRQLSRGAELA